jgi:GTPase SAR1 family protein
MPPRKEEDLREFLTDRHFRIVVIGKENSGKTTLINHLTGFNILNINSVKETSFTWRIKFSPEENPQNGPYSL